MERRRKFAARRAGERGYALLFVLFLVALALIGASTAVLNYWTEGQREKEAVMIWRGQQYQRAIGMFYRKYGRFPTRIDDLVKVQQGGIRFLRQAYTNPMNKNDGSWRFIYVTPAGQLIGSVRYVSLQQMAFLDKQRQMGMATGAGGATSDSDDSSDSGADQNSAAGASTGTGTPGAPGASISGLSAPGAQPQPPGQNQQAKQPSFFSQPLQTQTNSGGGFSVSEQSSAGGSDEPVIGGFIIGVAGKSDRASVKVYKGGRTYKQWEFIFNPLEQVQTIGSISTGPQTTPNGTQPPTSPMPQPMQQQQPQVPQ